jgi:hypothetical protein
MSLAPADLLECRDRAAGVHQIDAALAILAAASGRARDDLARLPLGVRDTLLLDVRRTTIGDRLEARDACPACEAEVELTLSCTDLAIGRESPPATWTLSVPPYRLTMRPLDSRDAAMSASMGDADLARGVLLERAVVDAELEGRQLAASELPPTVVDRISASLAEHDVAAELTLAFRCPACDHAWTNVLDVVRYVVTEMAAQGERILADVDALARTYGWSEPEVLALGEARRAAYVALVQG